ADKDYHFEVDNDENEYQLSLRTLSLGAGAKDELHIVGAEAMNYEGITLATSKMSVQPMVSLGGFEITPPVGLCIISGQHLVAVEEDAESEDEEEEDVTLLSISGKCSAPGSGSKFPQKKEKTAKTRKGPSSVEDIKGKMQASIEKGGSLPKVEAKFINYVKNCFRMAIQDLWQWRKSL
ncbi:hypothetical protein E2I00_003496, partial [Balaenoptera physalus]